MSCRLSRQPLEWINRDKPVRFTVEGKTVSGLEGDSITSALLASDINHLGRSFKYHRMRGALSLANHDVNALFQASDTTHIRGDVTPAADDLTLTATNTYGGLKNDLGRLVQLIAKLLPVGFYYKAFHTPKFLFKFWESVIRNMAGLGKIDLNWRAKRVPKRYGFCDVLVVGAGPSGMAAALEAAKAGLSVMLVDENPHIGGSLDYQFANVPDADKERQRLKNEVLAADNIEVHVNAEASGYYRDLWVPVTTPDGIIKVRSKSVIVAGGVFEQPAVFRNNDVPGVMLASGAQRLVSRYAVKPCDKAVLLVGNEEGYQATLDMLAAGVEVVAVADLGQSTERGAVAQAVKDAGVKIYDRHTVYGVEQSNSLVTGVTPV